ncbi:MAG: hypothetical protein R2789_11550 [Microthrixaceae bacterium]
MASILTVVVCWPAGPEQAEHGALFDGEDTAHSMVVAEVLVEVVDLDRWGIWFLGWLEALGGVPGGDGVLPGPAWGGLLRRVHREGDEPRSVRGAADPLLHAHRIARRCGGVRIAPSRSALAMGMKCT